MFKNSEKNPAYGMLAFHRVTGGDPNLFGSSVSHNQKIMLTLKEGSVSRELNTDWYSGGKTLFEVVFVRGHLAADRGGVGGEQDVIIRFGDGLNTSYSSVQILTTGIYAQYLTGYDGATMDETVATLEANGATEIERCTLNGLDAVSFSVPDVNAVYVVFITQSGNYVQFIFSPASDEGFASVAQLVTASIRPETEG